MKLKLNHEVVIFFLALVLTTIAININITYAETPIYFSPSPINVGSPETRLPITFNVSIKIGAVSDLSGWQINITYDPSMLQVIDAFLPSDNVFANKKPIVPKPVIDNVDGSVLYGAWIGIGQQPYSGSGGTLCTITFKALRQGNSQLTFVRLPETIQNKFPTRLIDSNYDDIPISYSDAQINVQGYIPTPKYTKLEISPSIMKVGDFNSPPVAFQLNITIYNVTELMSLEFNITFTPSILQAVNITKPSDCVFSNETTIDTPPIIDNENGFIFWNTTLSSGSPFSGNGTICTIEFEGITLGISSIDFVENQTSLINSEGKPIECEYQGGIVQVIQIFSQAILEVSPYKIDVNETQSYFLVNVIVTNVTDLYEWHINLEFNGSILKIYNYSIPSENVFSDSKFRTYTLNPSDPLYDDSSEEGYFTWGACISEGFSFYGNGVLCQIWFQGANIGSSNLTLSNYGEDTYLYNSAQKLINATVIDAGRPPITIVTVKGKPVELSYILGPIGLLISIIVIAIVLRLRRRRIELSYGEPIYYKKASAQNP